MSAEYLDKNSEVIGGREREYLGTRRRDTSIRERNDKV